MDAGRPDFDLRSGESDEEIDDEKQECGGKDLGQPEKPEHKRAASAHLLGSSTRSLNYI
jgi:hypothetical protein